MTNDEKVKILVVDDLPEKLLVIETILEGLGQEIVTARSGREALRLLLEGEFAVILLDVHMPDIDGLETAALIRSRKQSAHTPIIFITALNDEAHIARGYSLGAVDYIYTPVVPEILRTKVGVFVDLFRKTREVERLAEERIALAREQAARAAAEEASRRAAFLAEASTSLARSLDPDETLRSLSRLLVPALADFAAVILTDDSGAQRHAVGSLAGPGCGPPEEFAGEDAGLDEGLTAAVGQVLASGEAVVSPATRRRLLDRSPAEAHSWMIVRLESPARPLGAIALARTAPGRRFDREDLRLLEDLASRASTALVNAKLYRDIQEDDRRKNEFLAMLAHELRNPLAPIRNAVEILRHLGREGGDLGWASDVISRQVEQMVRLVDDLLDVSRITGGKVQLRKERVDVATVVSLAVETSRPLVETRGHSLTVGLPAEPVWVEADRARLAQVLSNVLNNAAKYTRDGGRIDLRVGREGGEAVFRVRDNGMGIPAEMLGRIFDLFTQVDRSLDRSEGGLGIGLTLVRRLMEMHGGAAEAHSEGPGRGSEFLLRLPAIEPAGATAAGASPRRVGDGEAQAGPSRRRVLIVDDNDDAARSLARLLRISGYEVDTAGDGPAALDRVGAARPDVILLDIGLPGMDGFEVARRIRDLSDSREVVLIALTGYGRKEDRERSLASGFDHHLVKPVETEILLSLLDTGSREG